jgi:hypothetical protein
LLIVMAGNWLFLRGYWTEILATMRPSRSATPAQ